MTIDQDGLSAAFSKAQVRQISKGGTSLSYIPVAEVIARLNQVLGADQWGYKIIDRWTTGEHEDGTPKWCMVHVELTIGSPTVLAIRSAIGGQPVKMLRDGTGPVDMGDEWKGAVSDALKKAAQAFGVGLDLARKEEAMAEESASRAFTDAGWENEDQYQLVWQALRAEAAALDDDAKATVKTWWNDRSPSAPYSVDFLNEYAELIDRLTPAQAATAAQSASGTNKSGKGKSPSNSIETRDGDSGQSTPESPTLDVEPHLYDGSGADT